MSCFNVEAYIYDAFREAQAAVQAVGLDAEYILVDDGSDDGTVRVLESISQECSTAILVRLPKNQGVSAAVANGVAASQFPFCILVPGDGAFSAEALTPVLSSLCKGEVDAALGFEEQASKFYGRGRKKLRSFASDSARSALAWTNAWQRVPRYRVIAARTQLLRLVPREVQRYGHGTATVGTILLSGARVKWVPVTGFAPDVNRSKMHPGLALDYLLAQVLLWKSRKEIRSSFSLDSNSGLPRVP